MTKDKITIQLQTKFIDLFQSKPQLFSAPGRINLIGEHTDYNDGFVLPAAIDKYIVFALQKNALGLFRFFSLDFNEYVELKSTDILENSPFWSKYLLGVLAQFEQRDLHLTGFDCVFGGNIPLGAGLSSSAALECGLAFGINKISGFEITSLDLVKMAQKAEHDSVGVMCGIMDQYASIFGQEEQAIQLDCRSNTHQYFPLKMGDYILALVDTKVKHSLASTEYNQRRLQCESGVEYFNALYPKVKSLRDVSSKMIQSHINQPDASTYKRCKYVVEENQRVAKATLALTEQNYNEFGNLMYQSHNGLQHLYEVSCKELDFLVDQTRNMQEVLGSRMMGGGFGGCTLNLIQKSFSAQFETDIKEKYRKEFGIDPDVYLVNIVNGVSEMMEG